MLMSVCVCVKMLSNCVVYLGGAEMNIDIGDFEVFDECDEG